MLSLENKISEPDLLVEVKNKKYINKYDLFLLDYKERDKSSFEIYDIQNCEINITNYFDYDNFIIYNPSYKIDRNKDKVKIFGENYVYNNKFRCIILYNNIILPLLEYFSLKNINKNIHRLNLLIIELEYNPNKSYMFHKCSSLETFSLLNNLQSTIREDDDDIDKDEMDISFQDKEMKMNLTNLYNDETSIINKNSSLNESSINNTNKYNMNKENENISIISLLKSLPKISNYKTMYFNNMRAMFYGCTSLISLPIFLNGIQKILLI